MNNTTLCIMIPAHGNAYQYACMHKGLLSEGRSFQSEICLTHTVQLKGTEGIDNNNNNKRQQKIQATFHNISVYFLNCSMGREAEWELYQNKRNKTTHLNAAITVHDLQEIGQVGIRW